MWIECINCEKRAQWKDRVAIIKVGVSWRSSRSRVRGCAEYIRTDRITQEKCPSTGIMAQSTIVDEIILVVRFLDEFVVDWLKYSSLGRYFEILTLLIINCGENLKCIDNSPKFSKKMHLSVPIAIYGDIHGQYSDIWRWFHVNGWPPETPTLFLGDYVDRGRHSTEIVMHKTVFIIRGNHEDEIVNKAYNFYSELKTRYPKKFKKIYRKITDVFNVMPIACLISNQIICMHGGLSPRIQTIADIAALQRPFSKDSKPATHIDILWSDPHVCKWTYEPNTLRDPAGGGLGYLFGPIQIKRFVKRNELSLIVRGHQPPMSGYERVGPYLITIFSSPGYRVQDNVGSMGASLIIDEDGTMDIIRIQVGEQLKLKRQRYKMDKGDSYRNCGKPKLRKQSLSDEKYS
ncbi:phosphoprotein phosphatase 1 domain protein [Teladorsagia circumcincta]|uniref:Serine/threonine-protein phosphatase n=1 Tax=Teladorsagia circumcincta TaxID=45464 RepID=A0A2G9UPI9_TELCI|nr:phosphoprotein phosphatase 1 domain protein [Teladorsagia circumcincta]